jgi:hypothetical protein
MSDSENDEFDEIEARVISDDEIESDSDDEIKSDLDSENESDSDSDDRPVNPDNKLKVKPGNELKIKPGNELKIKPGNELKVKPDNKQKVKPDNKQKVAQDNKQKVEQDNKQKVEQDNKQKVKPDNKQKVKPDNKQKVKPDNKQKVKPDNKQKVKPGNKHKIEMKKCTGCQETKTLDEFSETQKRRKCIKCLNAECREYKRKNRGLISQYNKNYKAANRKTIKKYNHKYNKNNRRAIQTRQTRTHRLRRKKDPVYKMAITLRGRIRHLIFGDGERKGSRSLVGCDYKFVRDWLESQFKDDMSFENHGPVWHVDHVIPCSKFDLEDNDDEQFKCCNWSNLQPLYVNDNFTKSNTANEDEIQNHIKKVKRYIKQKKIKSTKYTIDNYDINKYLVN